MIKLIITFVKQFVRQTKRALKRSLRNRFRAMLFTLIFLISISSNIAFAQAPNMPNLTVPSNSQLLVPTKAHKIFEDSMILQEERTSDTNVTDDTAETETSELIEEESDEVPIADPTTQEIIDYIYEICESYPNVEPELVIAIVYRESRFIPTVKNYDGSCVGLMQVSPRWHSSRAEKLNVDNLFDPYGNLLVGIDYLSEIISSNGLELALMLYSMNNNEARSLYSQGIISDYVLGVLSDCANIQANGVSLYV